jgi:DNA-binding Lrp family transcriptional regulator
MAGSVPLGAGFPDLVVAAYQPLVIGLAGSGAVETNILAYLRVVGRARPDTIAARLRLSPRTAENRLRILLDAEALTDRSGSVSLTPSCRDILPEVIAIEVKIDNWQRALGQALRNRIFAHRSFIALPETVAVRVRRDQAVVQSGIGVIAIDEDRQATIVKPAPSGRPKVWTYYYKLAALIGQRFLTVQ